MKRIIFLRDAEKAHTSTVKGVMRIGHLFPFLLRWFSGTSRVVIRSLEASKSETPLAHCPLDFRLPIGLAAGFDKNAEILPYLPHLGFGFAEVGTVTPLAQAGNSKPRLHRIPDERLLFNRMGFNNDGADQIARRVERAKSKLPTGFKVGINVGKNKMTPNEQAHLDYGRAVSPFSDLADFFVVNVSSPNTPGLRSLQTVESLRAILEQVDLKNQRRVPVLIKIAPEVEGDELRDLVQNLAGDAIQGWVLTNTLGGEWPREAPKAEGQPGGWSGQCLVERSRERLREILNLTALPVISVGGIMDVKEGALRLKMGARAVEIYSGWIYQGPQFPAKMRQSLHRRGNLWRFDPSAD